MSTTQDTSRDWSDSFKYIPQPPKTLDFNQKKQERDYAETPGRSALQGSNFIGLYNEYALWYKPEFIQTKNMMVSEAYKFLVKYMPEKVQTAMKLQPTFDSVQLGCIKMYTSDWTYGADKQSNAKSFYSFINHAIFHDNYEQLERFMPIIRMINAYLCIDAKNDHASPAVAYRGLVLRDSVIAKFVANEECRFATYLSTSYNTSVAAQFADWSFDRYLLKKNTSTAPVEPSSKVIFKIQLPAHEDAPHFRTIKEPSEHDEDEVLFVPYSKFRIVKPAIQLSISNVVYQLIELEAIDNINENNPQPKGPTKFIHVPPSPPTPTTITTMASPNTPTGKKKPPPTHNFF